MKVIFLALVVALFVVSCAPQVAEDALADSPEEQEITDELAELDELDALSADLEQDQLDFNEFDVE